MIDFGLILTYLLLTVAGLICVVSPVLQMKNDSNRIKKMMIPLVGLCLIIALSVFISSSEVLPEYTDSNGVLISAALSKFVGGSLITFYVLSLITIGSVVYSEFLYKFFNNGKK